VSARRVGMAEARLGERRVAGLKPGASTRETNAEPGAEAPHYHPMLGRVERGGALAGI